MPDISVKNEPVKTADVESIAIRFETRATRLRCQAFVFLCSIIFLILYGVLIFIFASHITAKDLGTTGNLSERLKDTDDEIKKRRIKIEEIKVRIQNSKNEEEARLDNQEVSQLHYEIDQINIIRYNIMNEILQKEKGKAKKENASNDWATIVQTNTTRFGSLLVILFLVNNFFSQYRYNIRLAGYHDARADVLRLRNGPITVEEFGVLVTALTPTFDFGKPPTTPVEQVIEIVNALKAK